MLTQEQYQEEFGDTMLHGLDSNSTYIPLRTNKAMNLNVAIRPWVERLGRGCGVARRRLDVLASS